MNEKRKSQIFQYMVENPSATLLEAVQRTEVKPPRNEQLVTWVRKYREDNPNASVMNAYEMYSLLFPKK